MVMGKLTLDGVLRRVLGKLTPDPAERKNVFWLTAATMSIYAAGTLSTLTILAAYLEKSDFSYTQIGFVLSCMYFADMLGKLGLMGWADRTQQRIRVAVVCAFIIAGGTGLLAAASAVLGNHGSSLVLLAALVMVLSVRQVFWALSDMMNYSVLVRTIRGGIRGRVWGITGVATGLFTMGMSFLASVLLQVLGYPYGYTILFVAAGGFWVLRGMTFAHQTELPDIALPGTSRSISPVTAIVDLCRLKVFRMVAYPHILRGLLTGLMLFVVPTQMRRLSLSNDYAGYMAAAVCAADLISAVILGFTLDRWGAGVVTLLGCLLAGLSWATLIVAPSPISFLAFFLLLNIGEVLEQRAVPLGALEIMPTGVIGGFSAARLLIFTAGRALASGVGGKLLDAYDVSVIFVIAGALKLVLGVWFLGIFGLKRPGAGPAVPPR